MKDDIKKFINYGNKLSDDAVLYALASHIGLCLFSFVFIFELKYCIINIPFLIFSLILYLIHLKQKKKTDKNIFFTLGLITTIASLNCQTICCFFVKMNTRQIVLLFSILLITNFIIFLLMILSANLMIKCKKLPNAHIVSKTFVLPFAVAGVLLARKSDNNIMENGILFFACFSFILSIFTIYLIKWYYISVLDKHDTHGDDFTVDK